VILVGAGDTARVDRGEEPCVSVVGVGTGRVVECVERGEEPRAGTGRVVECADRGEESRASVGTGRVGFDFWGDGGDAGRSAWCAVHVELLSTSATAIRSVQSDSN
jgi:hypothetical protein